MIIRDLLTLIKKKLFIWVCDYSKNSGEGKLARLFIQNSNFKNQFKVYLSQRGTVKLKYLSTFFGILYCWKKYLDNEKVCYLNYLPLWNFFLFTLLPPNTILGPVTGGAYFNKKNSINHYIRRFIFPVFYKISEYFLIKRSKKIFFSTDLLKKYLSKKSLKKCEFNFVLKSMKLKSKTKKIFDFIIYYRRHKNKLNFFPFKFINNLILNKYKIAVVGDRLNIKSVKNFGYIENKRLNDIQARSKYTIASGENIYSFFTLECLSNHVTIVIDKNYKKRITLYKKNFITLDFKKLKDISKL